MKKFNTSREIKATPEKIFAAISDPERLARWWGPAGFTNTITHFEFKEGGRWSITMHGPDKSEYPNENVFLEIKAPLKVVIQHPFEPKYRLTISLVQTGDSTRVHWSQEIENDEMAKRLEPIVIPANEQNLEKLAAEVLK